MRFEICFLVKMGLKQDMNQAFTTFGWEDFADVTELGSHLLTMEFLISLTVEGTNSVTKVCKNSSYPQAPHISLRIGRRWSKSPTISEDYTP